MKKYVIGLDYGSDSCRGLLLDTDNGEEITSVVFMYPRWQKGLYCDSSVSMYRQHPLDYIEGFNHIIKEIVKTVDNDIINNIVAISIDTTGSTPCAVDESGMPLALSEEFAENPNAMFILWKDHTSVKEADEITYAAKNWGGIDYTKYIGGVYSAEWYVAKILRTLRTDENIREKAVSWVEHCDFMPAYLTGVTNYKNIIRSRCAAGHKAMWNEEFDGLPSNEFFKHIDPLLDGLRDKLYKDTYTSEHCAGTIKKEIAEELGLPLNIKIGVGAFDCHMGAVGGNIKENTLVKVIGTSTCDIMVAKKEEIHGTVEGICGQVDGSVYSGVIGLEAGQSAFGDVYAWYKKILSWPLKLIDDLDLDSELKENIKKEVSHKILYKLEDEAKKINPSLKNEISLDWINGRRTPYANQNLKGVISEITLDSDAPSIYRSLIEATAFGAKAIVDRFRESGLKIDSVIAIGGIPKKSPLNMEILASVLNMPIKVCESEQAVALGAGVFASVVGGVYPNIDEAQSRMASPVEKTYYPNDEWIDIYNELYKKYITLGNKFDN